MKWFFALTLFSLSLHSQAVTLTLNLNRYKDTAITTCDWSTPLGVIQAQLASNSTALDFGNGSDGDCNFSGTLTAREYNCRTLTVSGFARFTGTNRLIIRVQGDTNISGTLSVEGFDGLTGTASGSAAGVAGPGGFEGGSVDSFGLSSSGLPTDGGGGQGIDNSGLGFTYGGGGGAGGTRINTQPGNSGEVGTSDDSGGAAGSDSVTVAGLIQSNFETLASFVGGSGGGAGGQGYI